MPDTKPPLFQVQAGLDPALENEKVVFEKYIKTRMGNAEANKVYANGDLYKIYLGRNESIKEDGITWQKIGVLSENGLKEIQEISKNSVADYISDGPHEIVSQAPSSTKWYFYFDEPIFVRSQERAWTRSPKFVRQMDDVMEDHLTYEHQ